MSPDAALSEEQVAHYIQLCLSEEEVPDEELKTLNEIMSTNSESAKEIALRLLDENMIRNWFRSEADTVFINEVQKRLNIRFRDSEFISAVMMKVHEGLDASVGEAGESVIPDEVKSESMIKYIFVPIIALIAYVAFFQSDFIKAFFVNEDSFIMTVDDLRGKPTVISEDQRKTVLLKMIIAPGDTLSTGTSHELKLKYPDRSAVEIYENSNALIVKSESKKEIQMLRGSLKVSVIPQSEKTPFTIHTTFGTIKIVEGMAKISISDDKDVIETQSGQVFIEHASNGTTQTAKPGQVFTLSVTGLEDKELSKLKKETRELTNE
ncbi:MAG: FecR family protein [Lentisphaeraceae bacterium]|nr:FecR family protein [Lentisphaeraceae bacterium]